MSKRREFFLIPDDDGDFFITPDAERAQEVSRQVLVGEGDESLEFYIEGSDVVEIFSEVDPEGTGAEPGQIFSVGVSSVMPVKTTPERDLSNPKGEG